VKKEEKEEDEDPLHSPFDAKTEKETLQTLCTRRSNDA
jgi:hypothetical protein